MMVLQSIDKHDALAIIDEYTGNIDFASRQVYSKTYNVHVRGVFSYVGSHFVAMYRMSNDELRLQLESNIFNLDSTMRAEIIRGNLNTFRLISRLDQSSVVEMAYKKPNIYPPLEVGLTPFVEEEDFDVFLLIHNIVNNIERMQRVFR